MGETLYAEYISASSKIKRDIADQFELYSQNPNTHPQYETLSKKFASSISSFSASGSELPTLWYNYWFSCFNTMKEEALEKRLNELREKLIKKSSEERVSASRPSSQSFNVNETLVLMEKISASLDALGAALLIMVTKCRHLGTTSPQALAVFTDEENIVLLNLSLEKLKGLKQKSDGNIRVQYDNALLAIKHLMQFAKETSRPSKGVDVEALAKATIGKTSADIVNMIRTACNCDGDLNPSNEKINKIFLDVCNSHFDLMS